MKISRRIRRSWLKAIPEWMRCFFQSVSKRASRIGQWTIESKQRIKKYVEGTCQSIGSAYYSRISVVKQGFRQHSREWTTALLAAGLIASPLTVDAAPEGGVVVGGQATITRAGEVTNIAQSSQRAAIDWSSFNIAKQETVNFQQPNSQAVALNRVLGNNASQIYGHLNANGIVYLSNPNGMLFAPGAQVNVAGLIATTSKVDPQAFMNSGCINTSERNAGISNQGNIFASGLVQIEGATAINNGGLIKATTLNSNGGKIIIGNADRITISGTLDASATQDSGLTTLNSGNGGTIEVIADKANGILDVIGASLYARGGSASGDGGLIETSGAEVYGLDEAVINAGAVNGAAGTWYLDPLNITIDSSSGAIGGTTIGADTLAEALSSQNVKISTAAFSGAEDGNIYINSSVTYDGTGNNNLWLLANKDISFATTKAISYSGSGNLVLHADIDGNGTGTVSGASLSLGSGTLAKIYYNPAAFGTADIAVTTAGSGSLVSYMLVNTTGQLQSIGNTSGWLGSNFALNNNLNMSGVSYTPIGNSTTKFTGKFDGQDYVGSVFGSIAGYTISNLNVAVTGTGSSTVYVGMFGYVSGSGAKISNLSLKDATVSGNSSSGYVCIGGAAGYNEGGSISGVSVSGVTISGSNVLTGSVLVGGAVGQNSGKVSDVTVRDTTISAGSDRTGSVYAGGVAGYNSGSAVSLNNITVSGVTISSSSDSGAAVVGGVAAVNYGSKISGVTVSGVTISGRNTSGTVYASGVVGYNSGSTSSLSDATVSSVTISGSNVSSGTVYVGGDVGNNYNGAISNVAVSGGTIAGNSIRSTVYVGGVAGYNSGSAASLSNATVKGVTISGSNVSVGTVCIGGIVGRNFGTITGGTVSAVSVSGQNVSTGIVYVGGVAGTNSSGYTISGVSVSGGTIEASSTNSTVYAGGVAGQNYGTVTGADTRETLSGGSSSIGYTNDGNITVGMTGQTATVTQISESTLTLGATVVSAGTLTVTASGDVTQSEALNVSGTAQFIASGHILTLDKANSFGAVSLTGAAATVRAASGLTLSNLIIGATGSTTGLTAIADSGNIVFSGSNSITNGGNVTLDVADGASVLEAAAATIATSGGVLTLKGGAGSKFKLYGNSVASWDQTRNAIVDTVIQTDGIVSNINLANSGNYTVGNISCNNNIALDNGGTSYNVAQQVGTIINMSGINRSLSLRNGNYTLDGLNVLDPSTIISSGYQSYTDTDSVDVLATGNIVVNSSNGYRVGRMKTTGDITLETASGTIEQYNIAAGQTTKIDMSGISKTLSLINTNAANSVNFTLNNSANKFNDNATVNNIVDITSLTGTVSLYAADSYSLGSLNLSGGTLKAEAGTNLTLTLAFDLTTSNSNKLYLGAGNTLSIGDGLINNSISGKQQLILWSGQDRSYVSGRITQSGTGGGKVVPAAFFGGNVYQDATFADAVSAHEATGGLSSPAAAGEE